MSLSPNPNLQKLLGQAVFERVRQGVFSAWEDTPSWLEGFFQSEAHNVELSGKFPFLQVFLLDAEELWADSGSRCTLHSDYWTETDSYGNDLHLCATAIRLEQGDIRKRCLLLIELAEEKFKQAQTLVRYAHETSLAYDRISKLSKELERATKSKSEFLARMSHEIRTPMNGILGMAELLWETPLNAEQREYVRVFRGAGDNLLKVINEVLDFSKVEAGQVELESIAFDLPDVLNSAIDVHAVKARAKGLKLSGQLGEEVPKHLIGDPGRLRQVFLNLLGNAIKFTDQGEVLLTVSSDENESSQGCLHFVVADTGIGIPPDRVASVFERFAQADVSTSRKFGGTGLGLAISKRFIELMGGKIWVESAPGAGTKMHFTARFGVADADAVALAPQRLTVPAGRGTLRLLLVDDSYDNRFLIRGYLKETGYEVDETENGALAVEKFKQGGYDVVLTDSEMPVLDGLSATREMRAYESQYNLKPTPIIILTAHAFKEAEVASRQAGCSGHLTKPIRKATLLEALRVYERGAASQERVSVEVASWLKPVVPKYLENRRSDVDRLRVALDRQDFATVRLLGHQMAGTGSGYGFDAITEFGRILEDSALSTDLARIRSGIEDLHRYLNSVELET